jgi:hypothetical protein
MDSCNFCKKKINKSVDTNDSYISYVHKDRPYGGYSKYEYPRYLCSKECLDNYEKTCRCNLCHIVIYKDALVIEGNDNYLYCDDIDNCNIGNDTCYNQKFNKS